MAVTWITGVRGFLGRHLAHRLRGDRSIVVAGLGHANAANPYEPVDLEVWVEASVSEPALDEMARRTGPPDEVYHLAGGSSVGLSLQEPAADFRRTVDGTFELLDWVRRNSPAARVLIASSAAVYGDRYFDRIPVDAPTHPYSPYGYHKRLAELLGESYCQNFGLRIAVVRLFSVYGPGLRKQLLWDLCNRLTAAPSRIQLAGTGDETRDWLFVDDAVAMLRAVMTGPEPSCTYVNGGTGVSTKVRDIAALVCDAWGAEVEVEFAGSSRTGDPFSLVADTASSSAYMVGAHVAVDDGIRKYVEWFRAQRP